MFTPTNGTGASFHRLSGASLAQFVKRMNTAQRAVLAAEIIDGRIALMKLTAKTVAAIVGVSQSSVNAALRYPPGNGQQSLPAIARWCSGDRDRYRRRSTGGGSTMMRCWLPSTSSSSRL